MSRRRFERETAARQRLSRWDLHNSFQSRFLGQLTQRTSSGFCFCTVVDGKPFGEAFMKTRNGEERKGLAAAARPIESDGERYGTALKGPSYLFAFRVSLISRS